MVSVHLQTLEYDRHNTDKSPFCKQIYLIDSLSELSIPRKLPTGKE